MFFQINQVHHEVVHVDDEPSFCKVVCEDMVHEHLEGRQRIALAEEHHCRFIKPISLLNLNIVIPPPDIKFDEIPGMFESINEVRDMRKRVSVLDSMRIYIVIVLARTERFILLWDKEEGGCLWELGREDFSFFEILINEHLQGFHLLGIEQIVLCSMWDKGVIEFNGRMVGVGKEELRAF